MCNFMLTNQIVLLSLRVRHVVLAYSENTTHEFGVRGSAVG